MLDTYPQFQGAETEIAVQPDLPLVMGNEAGLTQCFSNLLDNAVKFGRGIESAGAGQKRVTERLGAAVGGG